MNPKLENYLFLLARLAIILLALVLLFFGVNYIIPLVFHVSGSLVWGFLPFILAVVIAVLIDPVVDWLTYKKHLKRGLAVAITLVILLGLVIIFLVFIISRLVFELNDLYRAFPAYSNYLMNYGVQVFEQVRNFISNNPLPMEAQNALRVSLQMIMDELGNLVSFSTNFLFGLLTGLPGFVTIIIVSALATFFVSRDKHLITRLLYRLIPSKYAHPTSMIISDVSSALVGFFRAQTILISITGIQTVVGLYILGFEYALTVGIMVGLLDLLPILGPGTVFVPWVTVYFLLGQYSLGIKLLILYGLLVGVRQLIEPKIIAQNIGLHPLATLMALYLGLKFLGVAGIIIGPFLVIVLKAMFKSLWAKP